MNSAAREQKLYVNKDYYNFEEPVAASASMKEESKYRNVSSNTGGRFEVRRQYRKKKDTWRELKYVPKDQLNTKSEQREKITSIIMNMFEMENFIRNKYVKSVKPYLTKELLWSMLDIW